MARMIRFDHGVGQYEFENTISSYWNLGVMNLLCDANDLMEAVGKLGVIIE